MLVEARELRRAAVAYTRNGGSVVSLARGMRVSRQQAQEFLDGHFSFVTPAKTDRLLNLLDERSRDYVEEHMRVLPVRSGKIPIAVIAPVVEEAIEQCGGITALEEATGLHQRRLYALRNRRETVVGFEVADRLIVRTLGVDRWYLPDLRRWYFSDRVLAGGDCRNRRRNRSTRTKNEFCAV